MAVLVKTTLDQTSRKTSSCTLCTTILCYSTSFKSHRVKIMETAITRTKYSKLIETLRKIFGKIAGTHSVLTKTKATKEYCDLFHDQILLLNKVKQSKLISVIFFPTD